jgi:hypothetical protein
VSDDGRLDCLPLEFCNTGGEGVAAIDEIELLVDLEELYIRKVLVDLRISIHCVVIDFIDAHPDIDRVIDDDVCDRRFEGGLNPLSDGRCTRNGLFAGLCPDRLYCAGFLHFISDMVHRVRGFSTMRLPPNDVEWGVVRERACVTSNDSRSRYKLGKKNDLVGNLLQELCVQHHAENVVILKVKAEGVENENFREAFSTEAACAGRTRLHTRY